MVPRRRTRPRTKDRPTYDDAVAAFRTIFGDFRQSYLLRYTLRGVPRKGWHDISVSVTRAPRPVSSSAAATPLRAAPTTVTF